MPSSAAQKRTIIDVDAPTTASSSKKPAMTNSLDAFLGLKRAPVNKNFITIPSPPTLKHSLFLDPFSSTPASASSSTSTSVSPSTPATASTSTTHIDQSLSPTNGQPQSLPTPSQPKKKIKIAFCDLDGCLIKPKEGRRFPRDRNDWGWWSGGSRVKSKLVRLHEEGYHIIIISNQKQKQGQRGEKDLSEWLAKMPLICQDLPAGVPLRALAATGDDQYRKPRTGMFDVVKKVYQDKGYEIDMRNSFFVGDAAGRPRDHSDTDRKWAHNAGLEFKVPEELFNDAQRPVYTLFKGFDARAYLEDSRYTPAISPTSTPHVIENGREIVVFVGMPAAGKTTLFKQYFQPAGYTHVNQDTLKNKDKCVALCRQVLSSGKGGCVVDNTNRDAATRSAYIQLAREFQVPIRAFYFTASFALARHNNAYRAWVAKNVPEEEKRTILPDSAFASFQQASVPPDISEGFTEIKQVTFKFEGDEEERRLWCQWLF